jgi:arsenate reductase
MFSNSFAGIAPSSVPSFIGAQCVGGILAVGVIKILYPRPVSTESAGVAVAHSHPTLPPPANNDRLVTT